MKRVYITPKQNAENISFNEEVGLKHCILREASVVDEFYHESTTPSDDSMESVSVCDPIVILFNQQRLDNMGTTAAKSFIDSLVPKSNELSELRKKCSDEDLMTMVKSRHLQSPAEILAWCRYMNENVETFNSEVAKLVAQQESEKAQTTEVKTEVKTE